MVNGDDINIASKTVMVIRIILDRKNFTDDFILTLPDETGLFIGQWHAWQMFDKQPLLL